MMKKKSTVREIYRCRVCGVCGFLPVVFSYRFKRLGLKAEDYICVECQHKLAKQYNKLFNRIDKITVLKQE